MSDPRDEELDGHRQHQAVPRFRTSGRVFTAPQGRQTVEQFGATCFRTLREWPWVPGISYIRIVGEANDIIDLGIILALQEEAEALLTLFNHYAPVGDGEMNSYVLQPDPGQRWVATVVGAMGEAAASRVTERHLELFKPQSLVVVGISGGVHSDLLIGDVFVPPYAVQYMQDGKASPSDAKGFVIVPGPPGFSTSHRHHTAASGFRLNSPEAFTSFLQESSLDIKALLASKDLRRLYAAKLLREQPCLVTTGHAATGPVVAAAPAFSAWIRAFNRNVKAVDMETAAVLATVAARSAPPPAFAIRGISDYADDRKAALDAIGHGALRRYAIRNAGRFLLSLFRTAASKDAFGAQEANNGQPTGSGHPLRAEERDQPTPQIRVPQFHYGGVVPPDYFIGRKEELSEAEEIVRSKQSFLLVGERRAGKTSFCDALIHRVMGAAANNILVGKLNLESCENLTISTFLSHTLLSMIGEIARQVFGFPYSALLSPRTLSDRTTPTEPAFQSLADIRRVMGDRAASEGGSGSISLVPQDFLRLTAELLDLIATKGWSGYLIIYDEANRLATELSVSILMTHLEVLNSSRLITAYAASPEMAGSFGALAKHLLCKVHLGPFRSHDEMRQLLGRYYYDDITRTEDLPITTDAERLVWEISEGMPFKIQCLFAYGFARARRARDARLDSPHIEAARIALHRDLPEYFHKGGRR